MDFATSPFQFSNLYHNSSPIKYSFKLNQKNSPTTQHSTITNLKKPNVPSSSTFKQDITSSPNSKIASKIKLVKNLESPSKSKRFNKFNKLIAFGDSFTVNGNVHNLTNKQWPSEINYMGHFCNGKVWTEYLAESLNVELENYAFGGATA
ncbi:5515_t:CDS:2, partial [Gigaspora rosea]